MYLFAAQSKMFPLTSKNFPKFLAENQKQANLANIGDSDRSPLNLRTTGASQTTSAFTNLANFNFRRNSLIQCRNVRNQTDQLARLPQVGKRT
jgi:hypothetical protein